MFSRTKSTAGSGGALSPELRRAKAEKRRRFWRKVGKSLLWTLAFILVARLGLDIYASTQLNRELAAIRQKGEPVQFSELEPPAVPDAQNAWLVYQQATKSLRLSREEKEALQIRERNVSRVEKAIDSALRNNQKALALTRQAAVMPQCRFALNWQGDPMRLRFPHYAELRELAHLLAVDARVKARAGDGTTALRDVRALFGMSHHLSHERLLIGYLVAQSVNMIAHQALGRTLESIRLTVPQARALEASLPQDDWTRAFHDSLVGERTFGLFGFEHVGQTPQSDEEEEYTSLPLWASSWLLWLSRPVLKLDEVQTLRMWRRILDLPESQQVPQTVAFSQSQDDAIRNGPLYAALTKIYFPAFSRVADNRDRAEVKRRQREVALALTCFRTARGHYPASLQEATTLWGTSLPVDPYSQKPFGYRSDGKTFVLYSVGVNRVDEGGENPRWQGIASNSSADDIAWAHS